MFFCGCNNIYMIIYDMLFDLNYTHAHTHMQNFLYEDCNLIENLKSQNKCSNFFLHEGVKKNIKLKEK